MLLGAIDIGSNAIRLFFSNVFEKAGQVVIEKTTLVRIPLRLGEEVFTRHSIPEHQVGKLVKTMQAFRLLIDVFQPVAFKACATSAMREAANSSQIVEQVFKETGIEIDIIDGVEEAKILSAVKNLEELKNYDHSMYIDVGGGSTEISILSKDGVLVSQSFRIGTVRLLKEKVKKKEWELMSDFLKTHQQYYNQILCVATGGNVNKLSKLYGNISDNILPLKNLKYGIRELEKYTVKQRIEVLGLRPDRADVILPAAHIYHFVMKKINARYLLVPKIGLIDGIVSVLYQQIAETHNKNKKMLFKY